MLPVSRSAALLVVVGLVLLANPVWLVPHQGETQYTYERSRIDVHNGTISYTGMESVEFDEYNDLVGVGCQFHDEGKRACAFDRHLIDHAPVTVPRLGIADQRVDFVVLDGTYYRRLVNDTGHAGNGTRTYSVEPVSPATTLQSLATNITGLDAGAVSDDLRTEFAVALTGEPRTVRERLEDDDLGRVYRRDGAYYTVVGTSRSTVDHGLSFLASGETRMLLAVIGGFCLLGAGLRAWEPPDSGRL